MSIGVFSRGTIERLKIDDYMARLEKARFYAPQLTPDLVTAIKSIAPHLPLMQDEKSRKTWEKDQNATCKRELMALAPCLSTIPAPKRLLEIGPGLGRSLVYLRFIYTEAATSLEAYEGNGPFNNYALRCSRSQSTFCGSIDSLQSVLKHNGVNNVVMHDAHRRPLSSLTPSYNVIVSFYAIGFHWRLDDYLTDLHYLLASDGIVIVTVPPLFDLDSLSSNWRGELVGSCEVASGVGSVQLLVLHKANEMTQPPVDTRHLHPFDINIIPTEDTIVKQTRTWGALLTGSDAEHAITLARRLLISVEQFAKQSGNTQWHPDLALLQGYIALSVNDTDLLAQAVDLLSEATLRCHVPSKGGAFHLFSGVCYLAWTITHFSSVLKKLDCELDDMTGGDPLEALDSSILAALEGDRWPQDYDLIGGLTGLGVYFLNRPVNTTRDRALAQIVSHLRTQAEINAGKARWHTPVERLPMWQATICPSGYFNLGVAHGAPSILYFLGQLVSRGEGTSEIHSLYESCLEWILSQEGPPDQPFRYPPWVVPGVADRQSRLGWCYGDLGIAAVLHSTAVSLSDERLERRAISLLEHCLDAPPSTTGINDAGLCHGAFGVAHIYNRVYQSTGLEQFKVAAASWYRQGLAMEQPGRGVGGFPAYTPEKDDKWDPDPSILAGSAGVALALCALASDIEPSWDRILLLS